MKDSRPLIIGNWKMNGLLGSAAALVDSLLDNLYDFGRDTAAQIVLCPPFTLIGTLVPTLSGTDVKIGGQDCYVEQAGAYTGDISAAMLRDLGCRYVILGHSERRNYHQETSELVRKKAQAALSQRLTPIICVGETLEEREAGQELAVIEQQMRESIPENATPDNVVIAYEPVWAIGTGRTATLEQIGQMHKAIQTIGRSLGNAIAKPFRVVYGGSVKADNAKEIIYIDGVDGLLVGGASLQIEDFWTIIQAVEKNPVEAL